jgi:hypothetical protein
VGAVLAALEVVDGGDPPALVDNAQLHGQRRDGPVWGADQCGDVDLVGDAVQRDAVHAAGGGGGAGVGSEPASDVAGDAAIEGPKWAPTGGDFEAQLHAVNGEDAKAMLRRLGAAGGPWCCRPRWACVTILGSSHRCAVLSRRRTVTGDCGWWCWR